MSIGEIEVKVREALSVIMGVAPDAISPDAHLMDELGADSLQFLNFVGLLEKNFGVGFDGSEGDHLSTVNFSVAHVASRLGVSSEPAAVEVTALEQPAANAGPRLSDSGILTVDFEIGMPLTGRNNLAESPLLKTIGDLRWSHIGLYSGVASKDLADDTGERLYATFYYVEVNFPESAPLASYGENDRIHVVNTLQTYGRSIMDGYHYLLPASVPAEERKIPGSPEEAVALGVPYLRTSNIFVKMLEGASWLKKSKPCQPGISRIPELDQVPETNQWIRDADEQNTFFTPGDDYLQFTPEGLQIDYAIVPDRDLNGAGLLYFANYPLILDIVERIALEKKSRIPFSTELIDLRTVVRRRSAYLSNASQSDSIRVSIKGWMEAPANEDEPVRLVMNYVMNRVSDGRKMMVSTVWKTLSGVSARESGLLPALRQQALADMNC